MSVYELLEQVKDRDSFLMLKIMTKIMMSGKIGRYQTILKEFLRG